MEKKEKYFGYSELMLRQDWGVSVLFGIFVAVLLTVCFYVFSKHFKVRKHAL